MPRLILLGSRNTMILQYISMVSIFSIMVFMLLIKLLEQLLKQLLKQLLNQRTKTIYMTRGYYIIGFTFLWLF